MRAAKQRLGFQAAPVHALEQGLVLGLFACLIWKYLVVGVLTLHMVQSYVYLGRSPLWDFVGETANNFLRPLSRLPLRVGKIDLAPAVAIVLALLAAQILQLSLPLLFRRLPI